MKCQCYRRAQYKIQTDRQPPRPYHTPSYGSSIATRLLGLAFPPRNPLPIRTAATSGPSHTTARPVHLNIISPPPLLLFARTRNRHRLPKCQTIVRAPNITIAKFQRNPRRAAPPSSNQRIRQSLRVGYSRSSSMAPAQRSLDRIPGDAPVEHTHYTFIPQCIPNHSSKTQSAKGMVIP